MKANTIKIKREANIRRFTYIAHLSQKTGKLLRIEAGCRVWKTFEDAFAHYRGAGPYNSYLWHDDELKLDPGRFANRLEARCLLDKLRDQVWQKQASLKHRKAPK